MTKNQTKSIEAIAFRHGTQQVSPENSLLEVEARFEILREEESRRTTDTIKALEATTETLGKRKIDAEERWTQMRDLLAGREPELAKPAMAVGVTLTLIVADGQILAPVMDGLNVTDPITQLGVATVLVTAFSAMLKIAVHLYRQRDRKPWLIVPPAAFSLIALAFFGWWRGTEVVFAGQQTSNGASTFAADNPTLTKLFLTLATIALPVAAALALEYGLEKLRQGNEWRKARRDHLKFSEALDRSQKKLEAANEKRDHEREKLAQTRDEWISAAKQAHAEGQRVGAFKEPLSALLMKALPIGMLILAGVIIVCYLVADRMLADYVSSDAGRLCLYLLLALGSAGSYAQFALYRWNRPTADELYRRRPTHFRNTSHPDSTRLTEKTS